MRDNELIRVFLPIIQNGLIAAGMPEVEVTSAYQPTQQSITTKPTVYFYKVGDHRYGFLHRLSKWDADLQTMTHTEVQYYETTFQISALVISKPPTPSYTASDLVNEVAAILQSDQATTTLKNADVGILRVSDIRNPYFVDDRDRYEGSPSFDFVLTHRQTRITTDPVIESYEFNIKRV